MEKLQEFWNALITGGNLTRYIILAVVLLAGSLLIGATGRFVFGKRSMLGSALSSSIAIVFLYALTAVLLALGAKYARFTAPLPFVTMEGDTLTFFTFGGATFSQICAQLLGTVILAFVVSLADSFLPRGKNLFIWLLFRVLTVVFGLIAHLLVTLLMGEFLPESFMQFAPAILLAILVLMVLTGALKLIVGFALGIINPVVGALYTFFFANIVGRQLTRSVLTTTLIALLVFAIESIGLASVGIGLESLILYIPYGAGLLGLWYLCNRIFAEE